MLADDVREAGAGNIDLLPPLVLRPRGIGLRGVHRLKVKFAVIFIVSTRRRPLGAGPRLASGQLLLQAFHLSLQLALGRAGSALLPLGLALLLDLALRQRRAAGVDGAGKRPPFPADTI
jgi:hypothetical protein